MIASAVNPGGQTAKAFFKATALPYECVICDYCVDEFKRVIRTKFTKYISIADSFLATALIAAEIVSVPTDDNDLEAAIRDAKDRPILRAAIDADIDFILTGDKDFLESGIKKPRMITATEFLTLKKQ